MGFSVGIPQEEVSGTVCVLSLTISLLDEERGAQSPLHAKALSLYTGTVSVS